MWKTIFPPLQWIKGYSVLFLGKDAIAGLTLATYAIPVSLAYATLAGLPPQYGIYGYLIGGLFYAFFGTGMQLSIGPTSAISLIIGTSIASMAHGDPQRWIDLASLTALVMAAMSFVAYLLRLNSIINFISESILLGFKAGAAIIITMTQLPKLFGVKGGGVHFYEQTRILISQLSGTNLVVLIFGITALAALISGNRIFPGRPVGIVIVIASILVMSGTTLIYKGISVVGVLPAGLPVFHVPSLSIGDIESILPLSFACLLLAYIESVSAAKAIAIEKGYEINLRQELLALAAANAATAFGHGYPVTGGLSQSVVNDKAGAKTPLALVFASAAIAVCLIFFTGLLKDLPNVILASILLVAISGLVDIKGLQRLWRLSRLEFAVAITALISVILFGILNGVIIAAVASIALLIRAVSAAHVAFLGRIHGTIRYTDISRHHDNETIPGILIFRVEAAVLYFNTENIRKKVWAAIEMKAESLKTVIWDLSTSPYVDTAGALLIKKLYLDLKARGILLQIAEAHSDVRDILRAEEIENLIGHISRKVSVDDLVKEFTEKDIETN